MRLSVFKVDLEHILSSDSMETCNRLLLKGDEILLQFLLYFILQLHHLTNRVNANVSQCKPKRQGRRGGEMIIEGGVQLLEVLT
jgi:hypothetical protein